MFRTDSQRLCSLAPAVCLVAPAGDSVESAQAAESWAALGCRVHILGCGRRCNVPAASAVHLLDHIEAPEALTLGGPHLFEKLHTSDRVAHALRTLQAHHRFRAIEFPDRGGLGFRAIQSKQTGQAFSDVALAVAAHGRSASRMHASEQWLSAPQALTLDYMERYSLKHADQTRSPQSQPSLSEVATPSVSETAPSQPLVTICVPYFNLPDYLVETLTSLACQTYSNLEVIVINDGSTDPRANHIFQQMQARFPRFRFIEQPNAGIGAARNRGLEMARGEYFLPVDADNVADRDMVCRFVAGMEHNRQIDAMTCYFLAFRDFADLVERRFLYAYKPAGGPRILGCLQNIYGDGNALFRAAALRAVGGFGTERDTSFEDWEAFVKLVNAGRRVEMLPDFLFYYRHRDSGFSRVTNGYRNQQRVLRQYASMDSVPEEERALLWNWLVGSQQRITELELENQALKRRLKRRSSRFAERLRRALKRIRQTTRLFS